MATPVVPKKSETTSPGSALHLDKNVAPEIPIAEAGKEKTKIRSILKRLDIEVNKIDPMAATAATRENTGVIAVSTQGESAGGTIVETSEETTAGTEIETTPLEVQENRMKAKMTPTSKLSSVHCMIK